MNHLQSERLKNASQSRTVAMLQARQMALLGSIHWLDSNFRVFWFASSPNIGISSVI